MLGSGGAASGGLLAYFGDASAVRLPGRLRGLRSINSNLSQEDEGNEERRERKKVKNEEKKKKEKDKEEEEKDGLGGGA